MAVRHEWEPGDAFELEVDPRSALLGAVPLEPAIARRLPPTPRVRLRLPGGEEREAGFDAEGAALQGAAVASALGALGPVLRVRVDAPDLWTVEAAAAAPPEDGGGGPEAGAPRGEVAFGDAAPLLRAAAEARWDSRERVALALDTLRLSMAAGFDRLLAPDVAQGVAPYEHQLRAVRMALGRYRGRVLLCDEVGLGKTVEAGLATLELVLRGLARRILVLVPPSLLEQWRSEMREKFLMEFRATDDPEFRAAGEDAWSLHDRVLASLATARREPHASRVLAVPWDLVVVDEAHHLRNRRTAAWRLVSGLRKKYLLMLTATPVQNGLEDLYNLITLLRPGQLHTPKGFRREHVARGDGLSPRDPARLRELVGEVMVRHRRATCGLRFTRRVARTERVAPGDAERDLYRAVTGFVRRRYAAGESSRMLLQTLQMEIGSSPAAARATLRKVPGAGELAAAAEAVGGGAKEERLLAVLEEAGEKAIVFTRFHATQERLVRLLADRGIAAASLHGGLRRVEKEREVERFRDDARVLVSTEVGSEGRNLQFCRAVVNYDLPWNPMVIEQRIGRVSRVGQDREVLVHTLVAEGTIEDRILAILDARINLFELVVGELDLILGNLDEEGDFEGVLMETWAGAADEEDAARRMAELEERIVRAKEEYGRLRRLEDALFGE